MIRAFPKSGLVILSIHRAVGTHAPMPFAVLLIYQMLLDEIPAMKSLAQCHFIFKMLVKINVSHHILCLHPPMAVGIGLLSIRESLIKILAGESPIPVKELIEKLPFPQEKILTAIRFLADQDPRFTLSDGYLSHEDSAK